MKALVQLPIHIREMEIFYDGECVLCSRAIRWLMAQKEAFAREPRPFQDAVVEENFYEQIVGDPACELFVRLENQRFYRGVEAWILCLYSCLSYRRLARQLIRPRIYPYLEKVVGWISQNRHRLSRLIKRDEEEYFTDLTRQTRAPQPLRQKENVSDHGKEFLQFKPRKCQPRKRRVSWMFDDH